VRWVGQPAPPPPPPKKAKGCFTVVLVVMGVSMSCCCLAGMLVVAGEESGGSFDPISAIAGPETPLGRAVVPADLAAGLERTHRFRSRQRYSVGYGISSEVHGEVDAAHEALAQKFQYKSAGVGQPFTWVPPLGCGGNPWGCVFQDTARDSDDNIAPLTELFRQRSTAAGLDARATAELVVNFVQNIKYRLPTETYFELLPPELVVADGSGDCDSKSLLAAMILRDLGVETAMLYSRSYAHAALGVALPGTGKAFMSGRKKFLYVESTYPGWAIGTVPPQYENAKLWEVLPLR